MAVRLVFLFALILLLALRQALANGKHAVDDDGVDALFDLALL
jgi:hypothetical protein